jgi:hypothetical protein
MSLYASQTTFDTSSTPTSKPCSQSGEEAMSDLQCQPCCEYTIPFKHRGGRQQHSDRFYSYSRILMARSLAISNVVFSFIVVLGQPSSCLQVYRGVLITYAMTVAVASAIFIIRTMVSTPADAVVNYAYSSHPSFIF